MQTLDFTDIFSRSSALLGPEAMTRLAKARIILFGVGGVGSWCAEALVRTGLTHLTIVDPDDVCASNINRQLPATTRTVGQPKVDVLRQHLLDINPDADITARHEAFHADNADSFGLDNYDFLIDAIDAVPDKVALILAADALPRTTLLSSMGAARRLDPTRVRIAEFGKVAGCPLARALRQHFKRLHHFPKRKFACVFSDEPPIGDNQIKGSLMTVTAAFGLALASLIIKESINNTIHYDNTSN